MTATVLGGVIGIFHTFYHSSINQFVLMMKNIPDTFSIDFVCLQTCSFETVITIELLGHFPNKISKHAQLKHFANLSSKHALILQH